MAVKLAHDIEHDLEHTIPPEGGLDSQWLFAAMTARCLALLETKGGDRVLDDACGMGQDLLAVARGLNSPEPEGAPAARAVGVEPSDRMVRYAQSVARQSVCHGRSTVFVRALAEELPFRSGSFDALLCKGAMDHFMEPQTAMSEIARVLGAEGRVVLALANYDSLSCRLGRMLERLRRLRAGYRPPTHPYHEPPPDHMTRFGWRTIMALPASPLRIRRVVGISLLWGFPPWSRLIALLPAPLSRVLLLGAFRLGRSFPAWADVIVLQAVKA